MIMQVPTKANKPDFGLLYSSDIPQKSYFPVGSLEICNFGPEIARRKMGQRSCGFKKTKLAD